MQHLWRRWENWLKENVPDVYESLSPGASESEITLVEQVLGVRLPEDFRQFLRIHNGQNTQSIGLFGNYWFLSTENVEAEWKIWKDLLDAGEFQGLDPKPIGPIRPDQWWRSTWIPISNDGSGNHHCLDLDPAPGGNRGQVITMWHDQGERKLIAKSFREWVENIVENLENGTFRIKEQNGHTLFHPHGFMDS